MIFLIFQEEISQQLCETTMFSIASTLEPHWFPVDVFRQFFFFPRGSVFLKLRALSNKSAIYHPRYRRQCQPTNVQPTKQRRVFRTGANKAQNIFGRHASPLHHRATSRFGNGGKKTAYLGCIQRSRDSYLDKLATLILLSRMPRFSSTYVAHTHKLLANHFQTTITYQINVVRDFDYFLLEKISVYVTSLYVIRYYKVVIVQRGWLILILRWPVPRSRYLIRRLH